MDPGLSSAAARLLRGTRIIASSRDYLVFRLSHYSGGQQVAVLWDPSRDEFVLDVVTALYYKDVAVLLDVVALSMLRGRLTAYMGRTENQESAQAQIQGACDAALTPIDVKWQLLPVVPVPMTTGHRGNRLMDWAALAADSPLRIVNSAYQLGAV